MTTQFAIEGKKLVARTFQERLTDFSPELAAFLCQAWDHRVAIATNSLDLYDLYSGGTDAKKVAWEDLKDFLGRITAIHPAVRIYAQDFPKPKDFTALDKLSKSELKMHRRALARTFYHCMNAQGSAFNRIYVHASSLRSGLNILQAVIGCFPHIAGIKEAKIVGPGLVGRGDTIVIYLLTQDACDKLLPEVLGLQKRFPGDFTNGLPALVKEVAPGVGTSNEPPHLEILPRGGTIHSFGSFYCDLITTALVHTPNVTTGNADGRHMLDNLLWSLRMLGIDPRDHLAFPQRQRLEEYQKAIDQKQRPPV